MRRIIGISFVALATFGGACSANDGGAGEAGGSGGGSAAGNAGGSETGGTAGTATGGTATGGTATGGTGTGATGFGGFGGTAAAAGTAGTTATGGTAAGGAAGTAGTGTGACGGDPPPNDVPTATDTCGDGLDNDLNGFTDEKCDCPLGQSQPCFGGYPSQANNPLCTKGTQQCTGTAEFHGWGPCEGWQCGSPPTQEEVCPPIPAPAGYNPLDPANDEDCDGLIDEGCGFTQDINIEGDCVLAACPPQAPYPVGCKNLLLDGGSSKGCVSTAPGNGLVYFQEGDACAVLCVPIGDVGHLSGTLICSSVPGPPLNTTNCPIQNKQVQNYPTAGGACPVCAGSNPPSCSAPGWGC